MGKSLSEIVNSALSDADRNLKIASAYDATAADPGDFLAAELAGPRTKTAAEDTFSAKERAGAKKMMKEHERSMHDDEEHEHEGSEEKGEKKSAAQLKDDAVYGLKLATALEQSAYIVSKLAADTDPSTTPRPVTVRTNGANSPLNAPGPEVMPSGFIGAQTAQPKAQSNVSDRISGPSLGNSDLPTSMADHTGQLDGQMPPNNTGKTAGWTRNKEASERVLRAKVAQAELLARLGQTKAAEALMYEVQKMAQDPSSPAPELPGHNESFRMSTEPGDASMIPDNAGLISMTRAQAKDRSVNTVREYLSETPKQDNAVAAHTLRTDGLKMSSLDAVGAALGLPFGEGEKVAKSYEEKLQKLKSKIDKKSNPEKAQYKADKYEAKYRAHQSKNEMTPESARAILNTRPSGAKHFWGGAAYGEWDRNRREAARAFLEQHSRESGSKTSGLRDWMNRKAMKILEEKGGPGALRAAEAAQAAHLMGDKAGVKAHMSQGISDIVKRTAEATKKTSSLDKVAISNKFIAKAVNRAGYRMGMRSDVEAPKAVRRLLENKLEREALEGGRAARNAKAREMIEGKRFHQSIAHLDPKEKADALAKHRDELFERLDKKP